MLKIKLGIIGCGNIGEAIVKGMLSKKVLNKKDIFVSDRIKIKMTYLKKRYGVNVQTLNSGLIKKSDVLIFAVKPQDAGKLLDEIRYFVDRTKLIISVMAGVRLERINSCLGSSSVPVARVMPNMALVVGESMSAVSFNKFVNKTNRQIVKTLFGALGEVSEIKENLQDAFTALSGSGPAYFFYIVESFIEAAVKLGFSKKEALKYATQIIKGSAKILHISNLSPDVLRDKVTSKKGTTEAAINVFKKRELKKIISDAVFSAAKRSKELSC